MLFASFTLLSVIFCSNALPFLRREQDGTVAESFLEACTNGDESKVSKLLVRENLRARDTANRTCLMLAAENGHCSLVKLLMQQKDTEEEAQSADGSTALLFAAKNKHLACVQHITYYRANVSVQSNDGWSALHFAARDDNLEIAQHLLEQNASMNARNKDGMSPLMIAAEFNSSQVAVFLLGKNADVNVTTSEPSRTALHFAAAKGNVELVRKLLDQGANINAGMKDTPLIFACKENQTDAAIFLINRKADLDVTARSAIFVAIEQNNLQIVQALVNQGARLDVTDVDAKTPLMEAARLKRSKLVAILAPRVKDLEKRSKNGMTAFLWAADYNCAKCLKALAENKADVNAKRTPGDGYSALHMAAYGNLYDLAHTLVKVGIDVNLKAAVAGDTPIQTALLLSNGPGVAEFLATLDQTDITVITKDYSYSLLDLAAKNNYARVVSSLIRRNALLERRNGDDMTPLLTAAYWYSWDALKVLIESGADVKVGSSKHQGRTALHYASARNQLELVKMLVYEHANIEAGNEQTPLIYATSSIGVDTALFLIDRGANVNAREIGGNSPLHFAALKGEILVAERLLYRGANVNAKNNNGETPLKKAKDNGKAEMVEFLKSKGGVE